MGNAAATRVLLAAVAFVVTVVLSGTPAYGDSGTFSAPVYAGDFPDPSVILVNGRYWAYSTGSGGRNLQVVSSTDLHNWSAPADPLPVIPWWASRGQTWAPGVLQLGSGFVMYYTVHDVWLGMQCISVATSASPAGRFTDRSWTPLICQKDHGGSIDPNPYVDPTSAKLYLLWKSDDNSRGLPTHIWGQQLSANGLSLAAGTSPTLLLTESAVSPWQSPAIEGPTMIRNAGSYYLFYGANHYDSTNSGIGYATSSSVLGSFTDKATSAAWVGTTGAAQGPQGPSIFTDQSGVTRMAFAAWDGTVIGYPGGVRSLWTGTLSFTSETPSLS